MNETKGFDEGYFRGETSPINYESFLHRITVRLRLRAILKLLKELNREDGLIIDVGCALGDFVSGFSKEGYEAYGCDVSWWAAKEAKRIHPETCVVRADASFLPFRNKAVDVVTMLETLEHCTQLHKVLKEICRVVAFDGLAILSVPTTDVNDTYADDTHLWHFSFDEWTRIFEKKFDLVKVKYFLKAFRHINKKACNTLFALKTKIKS